MRHYFLSKTRIPDELPTEMELIIEELRKCSSQRECMQKAYDVLTKRYRGCRIETYTLLWHIFIEDITNLWNRTGFLHCHNMNFLMRVFLVKSGHFRNEDIENRWTLVWYKSPHQYLRITLEDGTQTYIDIWGHDHGIKLGDYAHGFHN